MEFKSWILQETNIDIFGFTKNRPETTHIHNEYPINPFDSNIVIEDLRTRNVNAKVPTENWPNEVQWGKAAGAIKINVSPLGSYKVIMKRIAVDLEGRLRWITKKIYPLDENEQNRNELTISDNIHKALVDIDKQEMDKPDDNYQFKKLVIKLLEKIKNTAPRSFMEEGVKYIDDTHYIIYLFLNGAGQQAPNDVKVERFDINVKYYKKAGLIRVFGAEIQSDKSKREFAQSPSEFDDYYMPSQSIEEITDAVSSALSTY